MSCSVPLYIALSTFGKREQLRKLILELHNSPAATTTCVYPLGLRTPIQAFDWTFCPSSISPSSKHASLCIFQKKKNEKNRKVGWAEDRFCKNYLMLY